jgi:2-keto-4-pentenoate hydratase/2-oxohepta-3-ene-1,7-dioic acid hydratase in catechol pathway
MGFRLANVNGKAALVMADNYYDIEDLSGGELSSDPMSAIERAGDLAALSAQLYSQPNDSVPTGKLSDVTLGAPVPRPRNSFAIGLNYRNHAEEAGMQIPPAPMVFTKFPSCITGPTANVEMRSDYVDFEGELVVVIGKTAKNVAVDDALQHVAGLCVGQDISDRPAQFTSTPAQFNLGKSFDTFGPIGPILVSLDEIDEHGTLMLTTEVNGEIRQQDSAKDLIFDVPYLVSYLSQILTLHPGDIIFTGTPGGVGVIEGRYLKDGDIIKTSIDGLGAMENRCVRISDHSRANEVPESLQVLLAKRLDDTGGS